MRTAKMLVVLLMLLSLVLPVTPAHAGGIVSTCDETNLRNALTGGGLVTFTCSGTITVGSTITISSNTTIDGTGRSVTISGGSSVGVFSVTSGIVFNVNHLTIAGGNMSGSGLGGGAITNNSGTVAVAYSTLSGNAAQYGGAVNNSGGTLTITYSTLSGNSADYGGAIINHSGTVTVTGSTLSGNSATVSGGAISNDSGGTLAVSGSTLSANTAGNAGGAIHLDSGALTASRSTFHNNGANNGGGIYSSAANLAVSNSTFSANSAQFGGGISVYPGSAASLTNSTLSGNTADNGGSNLYRILPSLELLSLANTLVANGTPSTNCDGFGDLTDSGGNLSWPDTSCPGINADPVLGSLQNNGGPTPTIALLTGSAALDAANDATCAAPPINNLDQRGLSRPQGAHCDIGAVEQACANFVPPATIGVEDIQAIAARWGWTSSTPGWDPAYDFNGDGRIDIVDIMITTIAFGGTCS